MAARDKFKDTAFSEIAQRGDLLRQEGFMREKDRKRDKMDNNMLEYLGTTDYGFEGDKWDNYMKFRQTK